MFKPEVGDHFDSIELAEKYYRRYAELGGFDIRISNKKENTDGKITSRYYVCSKQGKPPSKTYDSLDAYPAERRQRNSNIKRCGCFLCLKIRYFRERWQFEVFKFVEKHNHVLCTKNEMSLSRAKRGLSYVDHRNIFLASTSKLGVAKSHRLRKAMRGGAGLGGGTVRDYHNFKR